MKFLNTYLLVAITLVLASCAPDMSEKKYPKATHLYFSDYANKRVGVVDLNNLKSFTKVADATDGLDVVSGITLDPSGNKIYATEELNDRIVRFNSDGSGGFEVLYDDADSVSLPTSVVYDSKNKKIFWANSGTGQIKHGSANGGAASSLKFQYDSVVSYSYGLGIDPTKKTLFISDLVYQGIYSASTAGGELVTMYGKSSTSGLVLRNPSAIFVDTDDNLIYWADEGLNTISVGVYYYYSTYALATSSSVLYNAEDGLGRVDGIAVDKGSGKIYWTETGEGEKRIMRANLDGSGEREVVLEDVESYGIVLRFGKK
jgi:sugar lactone lactonase YvrE